MPGTLAQPATVHLGSSSFRSCPEAALDLGVFFGRWAHAVEDDFCDVNDVSIEHRRKYGGRGKAVEFKLKPIGAETAVGTAHTDAGVRWWCCIAGRLRELTRSKPDSRRATEIRSRCLQDAGSLPTSIVSKTSGSERLKWRQARSQLSSLTKESLASLADAATSTASAALRASAHRAKKSFEEWALEKEKTNIGAVHKHISDKGVVVQESRRAGISSTTPVVFMEQEVQAWQQLWSHPDPAFKIDELFPLLSKVRVLSRTQAPPAITYDQLGQAIAAIGGTKACGVEQLGGRAFRALP